MNDLDLSLDRLCTLARELAQENSRDPRFAMFACQVQLLTIMAKQFETAENGRAKLDAGKTILREARAAMKALDFQPEMASGDGRGNPDRPGGGGYRAEEPAADVPKPAPPVAVAAAPFETPGKDQAPRANGKRPLLPGVTAANEAALDSKYLKYFEKVPRKRKRGERRLFHGA